MGRTESFTIQVHPKDEQEQINLMEKFHWSLLSTQEMKTKDSRLELRGNDLYSVTETEHYVKLAFSRDVDNPHMATLKRLESEYFSFKYPKFPKLIPIHWGLWAVAAMIWGLGIAGWVAYFFLLYKPKKAAADLALMQAQRRQNEILNEVARLA